MYLNQIKETADFIRAHSKHKPEIALILGSGLGNLADQIEEADRFPYKDIPHFAQTTVVGHTGNLVLGKLMGKTVIALQGRFHYYEGYTMQQITFPVRVMRELGTKLMIVTNACGGINPMLNPGDLMFIRDHINFMGTNPLIGQNFDELGPRFPDMSHAYDPELIRLGMQVAVDQGIKTFIGNYTAVTGPYYFSVSELKMVRNFGSDAIGMSTVPETIVAVHGGMKVLGISAVTDKAIPEELEPLTHDAVVAVAKRINAKFIRLMKEIINRVEV